MIFYCPYRRTTVWEGSTNGRPSQKLSNIDRSCATSLSTSSMRLHLNFLSPWTALGYVHRKITSRRFWPRFRIKVRGEVFYKGGRGGVGVVITTNKTTNSDRRVIGGICISGLYRIICLWYVPDAFVQGCRDSQL